MRPGVYQVSAFCLLAITVILGMCHTALAYPAVVPRMVDLAAPETGFSRANGINDSGQIVGFSDLPNGQRRAVRWQNGVMVDLGTLGGGASEAAAINMSGQIAGTSGTADGASRAFRWDAGVMTDLGTLGGTYSEAYGINDSGHGRGQKQL